MRLVLGDVEVADAEREVDGVDVVEMAGAEDDVDEDGEQADDQRQPCPGGARRQGTALRAGRIRWRYRVQPTTRSGMRSLRLPVR